MLVSAEGLDGSGCTTLVEGIEQNYQNVVTTAEPSDLQFGQQVKERLASPESNALIDCYLFMADRIHHVNELIQPNDHTDSLVVTDRYTDSTRAYQPVALTNTGYFDSTQAARAWIEQTMSPWKYEPDLTLYIDISVNTALQRCGQADKYERRQFLEGVKEQYEAIAESEEHGNRIVRIDGEQSPESVLQQSMEAI